MPYGETPTTKGHIMNNKFARTKKFVNENKTPLALGAGILIGAAAATVTTNSSGVVLQLTPKDALRLIAMGGQQVYDTPYGRFVTRYAPAE